MKPSAPHYLLLATAHCAADGHQGQWHFVLQTVDGRLELEASDRETSAGQERLELLAVVRGLEALAQPSRVTLVTTSRQVDRGLGGALDLWRGNGWRWEAYGRRVEIKNADLWQRIDRALKFHQVQCRMLRIDAAHALPVDRVSRARSPERTGRGVLGRLWRSLRQIWVTRPGRLPDPWLGRPAW